MLEFIEAVAAKANLHGLVLKRRAFDSSRKMDVMIWEDPRTGESHSVATDGEQFHLSIAGFEFLTFASDDDQERLEILEWFFGAITAFRGGRTELVSRGKQGESLAVELGGFRTVSFPSKGGGTSTTTVL